MTGLPGEEAPGGGSPPPEPAAPPAGKAGRILLGILGVYALLALLAAYAQVTGNRFLLDLFDLRRWFTR